MRKMRSENKALPHPQEAPSAPTNKVQRWASCSPRLSSPKNKTPSPLAIAFTELCSKGLSLC